VDRNSTPLNSYLKQRQWPLAAFPLLFFSLFFFLPIAEIISTTSSNFFYPIRQIFTNLNFWEVVWFTLWQAALSTVLSILFAVPPIFLLTKYDFKGSKILRSLIAVPFVLPTVVVGSAFTALFTQLNLDHGAFNLRHTSAAILIAHIFFNSSIAIRIISTFWEGLDESPENQARVLGASVYKTFFQITLPRLKPSILSAATTIFLFCVTSFGIILILGGPKSATIETEIWRHATWRGDIDTASVYSLVQLTFVVLLARVLIKKEHNRSEQESLSFRRKSKPTKMHLFSHLTYLFLLFCLPIIFLVKKSLKNDLSDPFAFFSGLLERSNVIPISPLSSLWNSLVFALIATLMAVSLGLITSTLIVHGNKRLSDFMNISTSIPLGISAVTIGFGIFVFFTGPLAGLRNSYWTIPALHSLIGVPFVIRSLVPAMRRIPKHLYESSSLLGANAIKTWLDIDLKMSLRPLIVGAGFAFAVSLGEFGATSFLPRNPDNLTAPLVIYRLLGTPGQELRGQAMALALILGALTSVCIFVIEKVRKNSTNPLF